LSNERETYDTSRNRKTSCRDFTATWAFSIPIDPVKLADKEGIKVHNAVFSDDGVSGMVAKEV